MKNQKGVTVWFTGLPCCGKTTIAKKVTVILKEKGYNVEHLDGDIVRKDLTSDLGFSKDDREENIRRVTVVAKLLAKNNIIVLASFVSPYRNRREKSREEIGDFVEIFVKCSIDECVRRDVKGMYKKAFAGEIKDFTGVQDPYEEPVNPELVVESDRDSVDDCVDKVLKKLKDLGYIKL